MLYRHLIDHCQTPLQEALLKRLIPGFARLKSRADEGAAPLLAVASAQTDLAAIEQLADDIRRNFTRVVVAGSGGSTLSGRTLTCMQSAFAIPSLSYLENIDPDTMADLMLHLDIERTCFLIISKSGTTVETLSQFYVLFAHAQQKLGPKKAAQHFIIITTPGDNPLTDYAKQYGITLLPHAHNIGGRFSVLTNVGLLPAAIAGMDIRALRRGAGSVIAQMDKAAAPADFSPALGAAIQTAHMQSGRNISVMLPYCERLSGFSAWYRQNWAESLGKNGKGSTPIRAVGTTDQHSQLQLYLDGPKDKLFHLILLSRGSTGQPIPVPARNDLNYLRGKTTGDVMGAEQKATLETLVGHGCPVRLITLDTLGEEQMGALLMHFMLEIICTSYLLEVNPFDQPAVEEGKCRARDYLQEGTL